MNETAIAPHLIIDGKKGRFRFSHRVLEALNEPKFIQVLINPERGLLGIHRCEKMSHEANRIKEWNSGLGYAEIYCPSLIDTLANKHSWDRNSSYRLKAVACVDGRTLLFQLSSAEKTTMILQSDSYAEEMYEVQTER